MTPVQETLFSMQDLKYKEFQCALMPTIDKDRIIGVRTPALRKYAKEFVKTEEGLTFINTLPHKYYEENNLHAYMIEYLAKDYETAISLTETFLPFIDNWAACDTFSPKAFKKDLTAFYDKTLEWIKSSHPYTVRFGIVNQMRWFLDDRFQEFMLNEIASVKSSEYYVNMAIAWYFSIALIRQKDAALPFFTEHRLDKWIHRKALQKAIESTRTTKEEKDMYRSLK